MRSPSLREVQDLFWRGIAERGFAQQLIDVVEPRPMLDGAARLGVYGDGYVWRLRDVLREDFPRLAALLGTDRFDQLVQDYLTAHPSHHPSVHHLGRAMAGFIRRQVDVAPCLADLARLEWARIEAFDAPDAEPVSPDVLRAVPPETWPRTYLVPIPALEVLRVRWPVHELWSGADPATIRAAPTALRVWRAGDDTVYHAAMEPRAADALDRLIAGAPFGLICWAFADLPPAQAAREVAALLRRWLEDGLIAQVR